MPSFSESLERALHRALTFANERSQEYATLEHLLLALVEDRDAAAVMNACSVNLDVLRDAVKLVERRGATCEPHQPEGDPADAMLDVAAAVDADLIVVGSRGLARGTRRLRGSVSTKIAAHADRSFLVVQDS